VLPLRSCLTFTILISLVASLSFTEVQAEIQVGSPFGDHMVLQAEMRLPIWGTGTAGETVEVEFADQKRGAITGSDGRWRIDLEPLTASNVSRTFSVRGSSMQAPIVFKDVLVGEVWLCSGGSNMERQLGPRTGQKPITRWQEEVAGAQHPTIRQLMIAPTVASSPRSRVEARWTVCSPETAAQFTAVGFFMARDLQSKLGVPIGIINASEAASPIAAWACNAGTQADVVGESSSPSSGDAPASLAPSVLFNGMIAPLVPFAIRGVAFYQGEADVDQATDYQQRFSQLIADWRGCWKQGDFPFLFVQVAPYRESRPQLREAQLLTWQTTKNTAMVVTLDCGDIEDPHPPHKQPVGARLALAARALAYHESVVYSGPLYRTLTVDEDRAILHFDHVGGGLAANDFSLMGFTMAGPDGVFHAAHGEIQGETIAVSIPEVEKPTAVRYAWERAPDGNLVNDAGLPASPFRTDRE
jgi:sialate O-acetylesterase